MYPQLFSMIAPNLFQGGTDDLDVIHLPVTNNRKRTDLPFDAIVTMYAWARPADWNVQEFRYGVPDASIRDIDLARLREAVEFGYARWKSGDRVLARLVRLFFQPLLVVWALWCTGAWRARKAKTVGKERWDLEEDSIYG